MEDGRYRQYDVDRLPVENGGVNPLEPTILRVLDVGANYWSLWTEGTNLRRCHEKYPHGLQSLRQRLGYRVRPSWIWQRKRYGTSELVVAFADPSAGHVPSRLNRMARSPSD